MLKLVLLVALATVAIPAALAAQPYPNKPVRFIVPVAAGGSTDTTARIVAEACPQASANPS
ncbi:MAG: hypothetical protein R3D69_13040 [Xanthobacteraceae bacterium]